MSIYAIYTINCLDSCLVFACSGKRKQIINFLATTIADFMSGIIGRKQQTFFTLSSIGISGAEKNGYIFAL